MSARAGIDSGRRRQRLARRSVGAATAIVLLALLTACGAARSSAQLLDDVARALGRSESEVSLLVQARATAGQSSDDVLRRWAVPLKEPSDLRENARIVSCQTVIDLSASGEAPSEESLLILVNNIAGLDSKVAGMQQVQALNDAAVEQLGGKRDAVSFYMQVERFKDAVCKR